MEIKAVVDRVTNYRNGRQEVQLQIEPEDGDKVVVRGNINVNAEKHMGHKPGDTITFKGSVSK